MAKQYGLILSNKTKLTPASEVKRPSIFDEESESDEDNQKPTGVTKSLKRQDRVAIERAVEEDPTVYQYDEVYDEIDRRRKDSKLSRTDLEKKPKYIGRLLAAADKRKRENERRIERQVQREREAEGEEFRDKESFVTSAYRKKLEEFKKMEEEERREEYLEAIGDVTRQANLDGFYRHLYDQKVNYEADGAEGKSESGSERPEIKKVNRKRKYRKRESSGSDGSGGEECQKRFEHLPSNLDADSDFSIDSDSSESEAENKSKKETEENADGEKVKEEIKEEVTTEIKQEEDVNEVKIEDEPKKPKVDIWKKRTVGITFDEALQRYFERKSLRESAVH